MDLMALINQMRGQSRGRRGVLDFGGVESDEPLIKPKEKFEMVPLASLPNTTLPATSVNAPSPTTGMTPEQVSDMVMGTPRPPVGRPLSPAELAKSRNPTGMTPEQISQSVAREGQPAGSDMTEMTLEDLLKALASVDPTLFREDGAPQNPYSTIIGGNNRNVIYPSSTGASKPDMSGVTGLIQALGGGI